MQFYSEIMRRALLLCEEATQDVDNSELIAKIDKWFLDKAKPAIFDFENPENTIIHQEKQFKQLCAALEMRGINKPGELPAFDFYAVVQHLKSLNKPNAH